MRVSTGPYFPIHSCNSFIDTAGPAGASDKAFGHVDTNLDNA